MQNVSNTNLFSFTNRCGGSGTDACEQCTSQLRGICESYSKFFSKSAVPPDSGNHSDHISRFYSWKAISKPSSFEFRICEQGGTEGPTWKSSVRTVFSSANHGVVITAKGYGRSKNECIGDSYFEYLMGIHGVIEPINTSYTKKGWNKWNSIHEQSDTLQGDIDQTSEQQSNTIITVDTSETKSLMYTGSGPRLNLVSTEELHEFPTIMNRWMPFSNTEISTTDLFGTQKFFWNVPEVFYTDTVTPNLSQFRNFIFGELDIELRFIVNAHKFQAGKLVIALYPDTYQGLITRATVENALQLQHVIIDLNGNNHGLLEVPFRYRRPLLRLVNHANSSRGVRAGLYAGIGCFVLSPLVTGAGQPQNCFMRTFFRIKTAKLAGMSQQVNVQMDNFEKCLGSAVDTIKAAEDTLIRAGKLINWDKPQRIDNVIQVVPRPRLNFFTGSGISDAIQMRVNPYTTDILPESLYRSGDPVTTHDIASIWGLYGRFSWGSSNNAGYKLFTWLVDPASTSQPFPQAINGQNGVPNPFTFINGLYNFWSGPIEVRFDFVSNDFITGTLQVTFEPNRPAANEAEAQSTYTKTFHLGDQKTLNFTIPYINDNCMRRTGVAAWSNFGPDFSNRTYEQRKATTVRMVPRNTMSVRVINPLRTVATTTNTIDVLVFMRAAPTFVNMSPVMSNWELIETTSGDLANFPGEFTSTPSVHSGRQSIADYYGERSASFSSLITGPNHIDGQPNLARKLYIDGKPQSAYITLSGGTSRSTRVIVEQMDKGTKETLDDTDNFSSGVNRQNIVVTDKHDNIIDLLRRPVLIWSGMGIIPNALGNVTEKPLSVSYIPVMPPGPMWKYQNDYNNQDLYNPSIFKTHQAALVSCFRHWRGSLRITLIAYQYTSAAPIYVSYIPHNGTLLFGNVDYTRGNDNRWAKDVGPSSCGLTTEVIIPTVNPTLCVEIPFENEMDYLLTSEEDRSRNYAWREKALYNNGHLAITSSQGCAIDVWIGAGDSFYLCDFIGTYRTRSELSANLPVDDNPSPVVMTTTPKSETKTARTQSDFHKLNVRRDPHVINIREQIDAFEQMDTLSDWYQSALKHPLAVPIAGVATIATGLPLSTALAGSKASLLIDSSTNAFGAIIDYIKTAISSIVGAATSVFDGIVTNSFVLECVLDAILLIRNFDMTGFVVSAIKFVMKLMKVEISTLVPYLQNIGEFCKRIFTSQPREQLSGFEGEEMGLVALVAGLIGNCLNVTFSKNDQLTWLQGLTLRFTSAPGVGFMNGCFTFVKNFYEVIRRIFFSCIGYADIHTQTIAFLKSKESTLKTFVDDVSNCTTIINKNVRTSYKFRVKYWSTVINAYSIRSALSTLPNKPTHQNLLRICNDMIKHAQDNAYECSYSPVRYTPFVLCIAGPSNIGKSHCVTTLASKMLNAIGYVSSSGNDIYVRDPLAKHWNGFSGQKVVHMDDVFNLVDTESMTKTLADIYALKTTALFIPEQASIEMKGKPENPYFVIQCTNTPFPNTNLSSIVLDREAVLRRRDLLVQASIKDDYVGMSIHEIPQDVLEVFGHLQFQIYGKATDENSLGTTIYNWEAFNRILKDTCTEYHNRETRNVKYRMDQILSRMDTNGRTFDSELNPFTVFDNIMNESYNFVTTDNNAYLPSDILKQQLHEMCTQLEALNVARAGVNEQGVVDLIHYFPKISQYCVAKGYEWLQQGFNWIRNLGDECEQICVGCNERKLCTFYCGNDHPHCRFCVSTSGCRFVENSVACGRSFKGVFSRTILGAFFVLRTLLGQFGHIGHCVVQIQQILSDIMWHYETHFSLLGGAFSYYLRTLGAKRSYSGCALFFLDLYLWDRATRVVITPCVNIEPQPGPSGIQAQIDHIPYTGHPVHHFENNTLTAVNYLATNNIRIYPEKISRMFEQRVNQDCRHQNLIENKAFVSFNNGFWEYYVEQHQVKIPDTVCKKCCLNQAGYHDLIVHYMDRCRTVITSRVVDAYNKSCQLDGLIPHCMIPDKAEIPDVSLELEEPLLMKMIRILGYIAAAFSAVYVGKVFYAWWMGSPTTEQIEYSGDPNTRHFQAVKQVKVVRGQIVSQDDRFDDVLIEKIMKNSFNMELIYNDGRRIVLAMMGITQRIVLLPRHYYWRIERDLKEITEIRIGRSVDKSMFMAYTFDKRDFLISSSSDIAVFYAPKKIEMFIDLVRFMQTDKDLKNGMCAHGKMVRIPSTTINRHTIINLDFNGFEKNIKVASSVNDFTQTDVLAYNYSNEGACGSFVVKNKSQRPIVGMHIAGIGEGANGVGYSVLITQEMVSDIPKHSKAISLEPVVTVAEAQESRFLMPSEVQVSYQGIVEKSVFMPKKTKIIPSCIQGIVKYPTLTKPCFLSKEDEEYDHIHSPLVAGCMKHGKLTRDFTTSEMNIVKQYLWDRYFMTMKPILNDATILSIDEAISGFDGIEGYDAMKLDTSIGYPLNVEGVVSKKDDIEILRGYDSEVIRVILSERVFNMYKKDMDNRRDGVVPATIFTAFLKDERKKLEKRKKIGSTRIFLMSSAHYTIAKRQHYLHYTAAQYNSRLHHYSSCGIRCDSNEWSNLARNLLKKGNNVFTLDYSNFGPGFNASVNYCAQENVKRWLIKNISYPNGYPIDVILDCFVEEHGNSLHVMKDLVYRQLCGGPSGDPCTVNHNSDVNAFYVCLSWLALSEAHLSKGVNVWDEFEENVFFKVYGDDLIASVSDKWKDIYNASTVMKYFKKYDIVATDATKGSEVIPYSDIFHASFLKRSFILHPYFDSEWLAPLDVDSITETCQWIFKSVNDKEATIQNCEASIRQAYGHGKAFFDKHKDHINDALAKRNLRCIALTWDDVDKDYFPQYY